MQDKVDSWLGELEELSSIAITQPHAAFCAFTHGVMNKWRYLFRTTGEIADSLEPLEEAIRYKFVRAVTGHPAFSDNERDILSLPARMGELDLCKPMESAQEEYMNSCTATAPLVQAASQQERAQMHECSAEVATVKNELKAQKRKHLKQKAEAIRHNASNDMKLAMDLAKEKGHLAGSVFFRLRSLASSYIREHSGMPLPCGTDGSHPISQMCVFVART